MMRRALNVVPTLARGMSTEARPMTRCVIDCTSACTFAESCPCRGRNFAAVGGRFGDEAVLVTCVMLSTLSVVTQTTITSTSLVKYPSPVHDALGRRISQVCSVPL